MQCSLRQALFLVGVSCLLITTTLTEAQADLQAVEPDSFTINTDISTAFPGVTLSVYDKPFSEVHAVDGFSIFNNANLATTGTLVFGQFPSPSSAVPQGWDENNLGLLRAEFHIPTNQVQIDVIFDDDDCGILRAYDALDNLLDAVSGCGDGRGPTPSITHMINRPLPDIAYATAGGLQAEALFLDNLRFNQHIAVLIDIKPKNKLNRIDPNSNSLVQIAILTTHISAQEPIDFDATQVALASVKFGSNASSPVLKWSRYEDIDKDSDDDLLLGFRAQDTGISCGDTESILTGVTFNGQAFVGKDFIKTVGCHQ